MKSPSSTRLKGLSIPPKLERRVLIRLSNMKKRRSLKRLISRSKPLELLTRLLKKVLASFLRHNTVFSRRNLRKLERSQRTKLAGKVLSSTSRTPRTSRTACVL